MNDNDFPALKAQLRRARAYLWAETVLAGLQYFVKASAAIIGAMALLSISGLVSFPYWSPMVGLAIGAAMMFTVILGRVPNLCKAAELVDRWTGRPDLTRTCLTLSSAHDASGLVAAQAEAAARMLPEAFRWPTLPLRSMALPVSIILAGVIVMPGARDASATDTVVATQANAPEIAVREEIAQVTNTDPPEGPTEPSSFRNIPSDRPNLLEALAEEFDAPAIEIETLEENGDVQIAAGLPSDGDGAGRAAASKLDGATRVDEVPSAKVSLKLITTGSGSGQPVDTGGLVPVNAAGQLPISTVGATEGMSATRLAALAHADRELARRYLEKRSGSR